MTSPDDRLNEIKDLIKKYNLSEDILNFKNRNTSEKVLLESFISNTKNPYLDMKKRSGISDALIKANYKEHPKRIKMYAAR